MSQLTRRNHFVPQAYLRRWADQKDRVWCCRLLVSHAGVPLWKRHSVRGIGYHEHLYTSVMAGEESDGIETWLEQEFETPGQRAIERVVSERQLTPADWKALIRYAAAQDVRTPARYVEHTRRWNTDVQQLLDGITPKALAEWEAADDTTRQKWREAKPTTDARSDFPFRVTVTRNADGPGGWLRAETVVGRQMWLASIRLVLTETIRVLTGHRWSIMRAPIGMSWLTSDDPVVRLNYNNEEDYNFGGGWGSPGSDILFPLSPRHMLYTQIGKQHRPRINVDPVRARLLRRIISEHAHRWLYADTPLDDSTLRSRVVNPEWYNQELEGLRNWHREQTEAELDISQSGVNPQGHGAD